MLKFTNKERDTIWPFLSKDLQFFYSTQVLRSLQGIRRRSISVPHLNGPIKSNSKNHVVKIRAFPWLSAVVLYCYVPSCKAKEDMRRMSGVAIPLFLF